MDGVRGTNQRFETHPLVLLICMRVCLELVITIAGWN